MKHLMRLSSAILAVGLLAGPAGAQDNSASQPASNAVVGPPQLEDFSLNGTVTRRAEPPPAAPARAQPAQRETAAPQRPDTSASAEARPAPESAPAEPERQASAEATRDAPAQTAPALPFDLGEPTPAAGAPSGFAADALAPQPASSADLAPLQPSGDGGDPWEARLPWLLALLAAIAAAGWYFRRQRSGYALAGAGGDASSFDLSPAPAAPPQPRSAEPRPSPAPAPPAAAPRPAPAPIGIVSTRLRPWVEIEFVPEAAVIDGERATIQFDITIFNSGSAPAREVLIEAMLFNAGPDQDQAIAAFFERPAGKGERVPVIAPLQRMSFRSAVSVPREQMRIFGAAGRQVFVPLIAFNVLYGWSGGTGQSSASFLVGRDTAGEKMAPLRVDQGARTYRGLGAREHSLRVRK
ncbi:MAG TPA: hypothetical protein VFK58_07340 [Sphingomicrobium sp.]|nr:hypothetical protein [Sphingomicrobium sp.]